jgi:hypothetical protein
LKSYLKVEFLSQFIELKEDKIDSEDSEDSDSEDEEDRPELEVATLNHNGCVNRIRVIIISYLLFVI